MRVIYTDEALRDLDGILTYIGKHYPGVSVSFENRLRATVRRIAAWPESAPRIEQRMGVRVVPLLPYPYRLFYRVTVDTVEILYLHHAARQEPWDVER
jgi:toxin ParE1/3/4